MKLKVLLIIAAIALLSGCQNKSFNKLTIWTDDNGCQYIRDYDAGITPRLAPDGTQICKHKK